MNKKQAQTIINEYNNAIEKVKKICQDRWFRPARRASAQSPGCPEGLVHCVDFLKVILGNTDLQRFINEFGVTLNEPKCLEFDPKEKGAQICRVPIDKLYLDMTGQRITEFLRCFMNIVIGGGYDCALGNVIAGSLRPDGKVVISDGGHRVLMAIISGRNFIEVNIVPPKSKTLSGIVKEEGKRFTGINDTQESVPEDELFRASYLMGEEDQKIMFDYFDYIGYDVGETLPHDDGLKMEKPNEFAKDYILRDEPKIKSKSGFVVWADKFDFKTVIEQWRIQYPDAKKAHVRSINALARVHWKIRTNRLDLKYIGFELTTEMLLEKFCEFSDNYASSSLITMAVKKKADGLNKQKQPADDFALLCALFKNELSKSVKIKLLKDWGLEDIIVQDEF